VRVFLTGATGFIGSHVARLLVAEGCEVYALVRPGSNLWRIEDIVPLLQVVPYDLFEKEELEAELSRIRPELCLHLAWYAEPGKYLASRENIRLLNASLNLATLLESLGCKRFVSAGTCFEYDTSLGYLSETTPTAPSSIYAASKLALHLVLEQIAGASSMSVAWIRLFYQYGPYEHERRLVPSVTRSLLRNQVAEATLGEQVRDFLHVEDVALAAWAVARSGLSGPVNIGSGEPVTVREIVTTIGAVLNRPELIALGALPDRASDPPFVCADNRRLVENTGWAPRYGLEEGLGHTVAWWQAHLRSCLVRA